MRSKNNLIILFLLLSISALLLLSGCDSGSDYGSDDYDSSDSDNLGAEDPSSSGLDDSGAGDPDAISDNLDSDNEEPIESDKKDTFSSSGLKFGIEGLSYDEFGVDPSIWFENAKKRGVSLVSFDPFNIEDGLTIVDSPILKDMGFVLDPEFPSALENIFDIAKNNNIDLTIMIEALAHAKSGFLGPSDSIKKSRITPKTVGKFIEELGIIADANGMKISISEEAYDEEFLPSIASSAKKAGIEYVHFFDDLDCNADTVLSEDYGYYFKDLRNNAEDKEQAKKNLAIGSYFGELGFLNIMYGAANACSKRFGTLTAGGWGLGPRTHQNIALLRSVQFIPKSVFFVMAEDAEGNTLEGEPEYVSNYDFSDLDKLINEFGRKKSDSKKPIANLIIDMPKSGDAKDYFDIALLGSVSAITNSMLAAGFDLSVSKDPVENADLYYVFSSGFVFEEGRDLSTGLLNLRGKGVPVFYQLAGEVSGEFTPNWQSLFTYFGINDYTPVTDDTGDFEPIPLKVRANFPNGEYEFNYAGYTLEVDDTGKLGSYSEAHTLHFIDPESTTSDVLLSGMTSKDKSSNFDDETALILRKDNVYFVNGGYLHFAAVPFLTNLMAKEPVFNKPGYVYATTGKDRNVFFTAYPAELDVNLPGGSRLTEFDETGRKATPKSSLDGDNLKGSLDKFHLLIVD